MRVSDDISQAATYSRTWRLVLILEKTNKPKFRERDTSEFLFGLLIMNLRERIEVDGRSPSSCGLRFLELPDLL